MLWNLFVGCAPVLEIDEELIFHRKTDKAVVNAPVWLVLHHQITDLEYYKRLYIFSIQ